MRARTTRTVRDDLAALASLPRAALAYLGRAAERVTQSARLPATPLSSVLPTPRNGRLGEANDWNVAEAMRANTGHVYTAVSFTANQIETLSETERLTARRPGDKTATVIEDHYILDALREPNELYSGAEMKGLTSGLLDTAGFMAWAKVRDDSNRQLQFWPLLPDRTRLVPGKLRPIEGVNYYPDGLGQRAIGFPREDVVLFRTRSLAGGLYGWPPLRAALREKLINDKSLQMRLVAFENNARPDYWLAPKLPVGKERPKALATLWANLMIHHQGIDKSGIPLVVPEGTKLGVLGFNAQDVQLIEQLGLSRRDLYSIFGTSDLIHGYKDSVPELRALEAELTRFGKAKLEPQACLIWGAINRDVIRELNAVQTRGVRLKLERDSAIPADKDFDLRKGLEGWKAKLLRRNQALTLLDEPTVDGPEGDEYAPDQAQSIPLANARVSASTAAEIAKELAPSVTAELRGWLAEQIQQLPAVRDVAPIEVRALPPVTREVTHPTVDQLDTDEKRAAHWEKSIQPQDDHTARATRVMRQFFKAQADRVLPEIERGLDGLDGKFAGWSSTKVRKHFAEVWIRNDWHKGRREDNGRAVVKMGKDEPQGFDGPAERDHLLDALRPVTTRAADDGGKLLANQLGLAWDIENPKAERWLETHLTQTAADITDTSAQILSATIRDGVADGKSTQEIMRDLRTTFAAWSDQGAEGDGVLPGYRAARIARTEIGTAFGRSQQLVLEDAKDEGLVDEKMWLTARDEHVRDSHRIDGETSAIDGEFSNGLKYPGDPSAGPGEICNCRCTIAAVVKGA